MISLHFLQDDELLLVLPKLRLGELLKLKNTCKRFNNLVSTHFKLQKVLDYSLPVPLEEARKANDEKEIGNLIRATAGTNVTELRFSRPEPLEDYLKMTRSLILSTAGPNLTELRFREPRGEEKLYLEDDFVAALADKCPGSSTL
ncbi:hypothetical protein HDE_00972 [Halotydeus destructor]|nr:hypothetical protein HDE_00972 [Halotydeus destructor]